MKEIKYSKGNNDVAIVKKIGWMDLSEVMKPLEPNNKMVNVKNFVLNKYIVSIDVKNSVNEVGGLNFNTIYPDNLVLGNSELLKGGYVSVVSEIAMIGSAANLITNGKLSFNNIRVTDIYGVPVENYKIVVADLFVKNLLEVNQALEINTDGDNWEEIVYLKDKEADGVTIKEEGGKKVRLEAKGDLLGDGIYSSNLAKNIEILFEGEKYGYSKVFALGIIIE